MGQSSSLVVQDFVHQQYHGPSTWNLDFPVKLLGIENEFGQFPQILLRNFSDSSLDEGTMVGIGGTYFVCAT